MSNGQSEKMDSQELTFAMEAISIAQQTDDVHMARLTR